MSRSDRKWLRSPSERVGTLSHADLPPPTRQDAPGPEHLLVRALRERDERAFEALLDRYYSPMLRLAQAYVRSREEAEEVVQDTWLAVLAGLDRFEGRSSLKTWIFNILVNRARSRAKREARLVPFSSFPQAAGATNGDGALPVADRLLRRDPGLSSRWHGKGWEPAGPEERLLSTELHARIDAAISTLPPRQQEVITLRDLDGWTSDEVCGALEISEANQRVLLHRARVKVRDALETYLAPPDVDGTPAATCLA